MRSSALTTIATIALLSALAGTSAAQSGGGAPPPPPPAADDDDDDDDFDLDEPADSSDDDDDDELVPATAPTPTAPGRELSTRRPAPDDDPAAPDAHQGASIFVALELGVGGVIAGGSELYGAGFGRGFAAGVRWRRTSIEWHFGELYDAPVDERLVATNTAGQLSMSSLGVRFAATPSFSLYGGLAKASVPLLVRESDTVVRAAALDGIGPTGGVAVEWRSGNLRFGAELRLAALVITDAVPAHLTISGPADASGMIPVTTDRASGRPLIATLTATVRLVE